MILCRRIVVFSFFQPICTIPCAIHNRIIQITRKQTLPVVCTVFAVHNFHILACVQQFRFLGYLLPAIITIIGNLNLTFFSLTGSDQDYTVSSTGTVNRSRSSIFQDIDRFDIRWVQHIDIASGYTVNYIQRCRGTDSTHTTYIYFITFTRHT